MVRIAGLRFAALVLSLAAASLDLAGCYRSFARERVLDDAYTDGDACVPTAVPARRVYPGVFVLLDRSRSMAMEGWNYWDPARESIKRIVGSFEQDVAFGLGMFPDPACDEMLPNCCAMPGPLVGVARLNADEIAFALDSATNHGGTPTAPSVEAIASPLASAIADRAAYLLLVTDGAPNCNASLSLADCTCTNPSSACDNPTQCLDDARTYDNLDVLLDGYGVPTFVVGLVGGAGGDWVWVWVMEAMADAGGTGSAFIAMTPDDVEPVMDEISGMITPCLFDVDPLDLEDPERLVFDVAGTPWPRDEARLAGWDIVEPDRIRFYGAPCDEILGSGIDSIEGVVPCLEADD